MTRDVLITIQGMQMTLDSDDNIEMTTLGKYYKKDDKHYIFYEEVLDCNEPCVQNSIKIYGDKVEVCKKGGSNAQMFFETGKKNTSMYSTPFGTIEIGVCTQELRFHETKDKLTLSLRYDLEMNGEYISDSEIHMKVEAMNKG